MEKKTLPLPQMPKRRVQKIYQHVELTKEEIAIIDRIARENSQNRRKKLGFLESDDLYGEVWLICLEVMPKFNNDLGGLENFLRVSVRNRIVNKFKTMTKTVYSPCKSCEFHRPEWPNTDCAKFKQAGTQANPGERRMLCNKWSQCVAAIERRNNLLNATESAVESYSSLDNPLEKLIGEETISNLLAKIPDPSIRVDILKLIEGGFVSKYRIAKIKKVVEEIIANGS